MYLLVMLKILVSLWILHSALKIYGTCKGLGFKLPKKKKLQEAEVKENGN